MTKDNKKIIYIDMDNVLVNFQTGIDRLPPKILESYRAEDGKLKDVDECEGIFRLMDPKPGAIEAFELLAAHHHVYILSTAPWKNHSAWSDKVDWVQRYLPSMVEGEAAHKRLILSHHKNLNRGDYLIDDRTANGAGKFEGKLLHFGEQDKHDCAGEPCQGVFLNWDAIIGYFQSEGLLPN